MEHEQTTTDLANRVLTITLNRPERLNAWTPTMSRELIAAFDRADDDDEVRAVIVTGAGAASARGPTSGPAERPSARAGRKPARPSRGTTAAASRSGCSNAASR